MPMLHIPRNPLRAAILASLSLAPVVHAAPVAPGAAVDASEFLVSTQTAGTHLEPQVARDAAGDFVAVWETRDTSVGTSTYDIFAQRYDAAGKPQGSQFLVNTFTSGAQESASVAMDAAGDFVVVWQSLDQISAADSYEVFAQRYNAAGQTQGGEFLVNTVTSGAQMNPKVAMDAAGDFVVAWQSSNQAAPLSGYDIYARQFNAAGTAIQSSEFLVNTFTTGKQIKPSVAMDAAGDFVVAWQSEDQASSGSNYDIYAREFTTAGGALQANEFLVNTITGNAQNRPTVAMDALGDFVVAWQSYGQAGSPASVIGYDIYARQYKVGATPLQSSEFLVNTFALNDQRFPAVAIDAQGDFVVTWDSFLQASISSQNDVYAQRYDATGHAKGTEFLVNTFTSNDQTAQTVAMDAAGDFVVVWASFGQVSSASAFDIYARRYQGPESADLAATLVTSPASTVTGGNFTLTLGLDNKTAAGTFIGSPALDSGIGAASGISAVFTVPAGVTLGQTTGNNWSCGSVSGTSLTCSFTGTLGAVTAAPALSLDFTAPTSAGNLAFSAQVTALAQQDSGDATGNSASTSVTVKLPPPTSTAGSVSTTAGTAVTGSLNGSGTGTLTYAIATQPAHGTVNLTNAATGAFSYTPTAGFSGNDSFTFVVSNSGGTSSAATESITVNAASGGGGGGTTGGGSGGGSSGGGSYGGGGGAFGLLSLAFLGLPLLRRRRPAR